MDHPLMSGGKAPINDSSMNQTHTYPLLSNSGLKYTPMTSLSNEPKKIVGTAQNSQIDIKTPDYPDQLNLCLFSESIFYNTNSGIPPSIFSPLFVEEGRNSDPSIARLSTYFLYGEADVMNRLKIPIILFLHPFNSNSNITFLEGQNGAICINCDAYANTYIEFNEFDNTWICNLCSHINRTDASESVSIRDSLKYPTVQYELTELKDDESVNSTIDLDYYSYEENTIVLIIGIELTSFSTESGLYDSYLEILSTTIRKENLSHSYSKVLIFTYNENSRIIYSKNGAITIRNQTGKPTFIPENCLTDLESAGDVIQFLMEENRNNNSSESMKLVDLDKCLDLLKGIAVLSKGSKCLLLGGQFGLMKGNFQSYLDKLLDLSICLNIVVYKGKMLERILPIVEKTGGCLIEYNALKEVTAVKTKLLELIRMESVFNVDIQVRTSEMLVKNSIYGPTQIDNLNLIHFTKMDETSTVYFSFRQDSDLKNESNCLVQAIIRFNSLQGRKALVINHAFKSTKNIVKIFNNLSYEIIMASFIMFHIMCKEEKKHSLKIIDDTVENMLIGYRQYASKNASSSQLILPENLKFLPLLVLALKKRSCRSLVSHRLTALNSTLTDLMTMLYPILFDLSEFVINRNVNGLPLLRLSLDSLDSSNVYVMAGSFIGILIYIGHDVDQELESSLLGYNQAVQLGEGLDETQIALSELLEYFFDRLGWLKKVDVTFINKNNEIKVVEELIEDELDGIVSYSDFLIHLHFKVKNKLE